MSLERPTALGPALLSREPPGAAEAPAHFTYDPADPVPTVGGHGPGEGDAFTPPRRVL
jgi:hypothetical protein